MILSYFSIFWYFSLRGITKKIEHELKPIFSHFLICWSFFIFLHWSYFRFLLIFCTVVKDVGRSYKNSQSKISTTILKKPVLSYSASHTSYASHSIQTFILYIPDNKQINTNKNKNNISNIDDIQSCVTPRKKIHSVQTTSTPTNLISLNELFHPKTSTNALSFECTSKLCITFFNQISVYFHI